MSEKDTKGPGMLVAVRLGDHQIEKLDDIANALPWLDSSNVIRLLIDNATVGDVVDQILDEARDRTKSEALLSEKVLAL